MTSASRGDERVARARVSYPRARIRPQKSPRARRERGATASRARAMSAMTRLNVTARAASRRRGGGTKTRARGTNEQDAAAARSGGIAREERAGDAVADAERASRLVRSGRTSSARELAWEALMREPESARAARSAVRACFGDGDGKEGRRAMEAHRAALGDAGVDVGTLCAWAAAEASEGTRDGEANARALWREATSVSGGSGREMCDAWTAFGNHESERGRADKARKCYKSAMSAVEGEDGAEARVSAATAAHSWARLEARERNPKLARELFARSVELCESHVANYTAWSAFELSRGQSDQARELLERGATFCRSAEESRGNNPASRRARSMASALYTSWGDLEGQSALRAEEDESALEVLLEKSRDLFQRACDVDKRNVAAWLKWSELEKEVARGESHRGGIVTSARRSNISNRRQLEILSSGLKANPGNMRLEHAFAMALKLNGDVESATNRLRRLSERFPKSSHVWHALGTVLQESGDFEGAIAAFERGSFASGRANLPCITAAAAAEFHGGNHGRARQLFVQGESVPRHLSSRRERAAHLRLWALLEKRVGSEEMTRKLFLAATNEDRSDAATWLQWGQWEKRVNSIEAARKVLKDGVRYGVNNGQYFVFQALATLEAEAGNPNAARELFTQGCTAHPRSASLWLQWALFELSCEGVERVAIEKSISVVKKGVARAPPHIPLLELWLNLERRSGDEQAARDVEDKLKKFLSEQRCYAPAGQEVKT